MVRLTNTPSGLTESMGGEIISRINQSITKLINQSTCVIHINQPRLYQSNCFMLIISLSGRYLGPSVFRSVGYHSPLFDQTNHALLRSQAPAIASLSAHHMIYTEGKL